MIKTIGAITVVVPRNLIATSLADQPGIRRVDGQLFDLMERLGELKNSKTGDRQAVAAALGKLLRRALAALLREEAFRR